MALIGNYSVYLKNPATYIGGVQVSNVRSAFNQEGQMLQMYYGESEGGGLPFTASLDTGTEPPYSWHLAEVGGELSSTTMISGTATLTASQQNGINIVSTIAGVGTIDTAGLALVTSMIATIAGSGALTGSMVGTVQLAADLAGSGDVTGSLGMLSGLVADLAGSGVISSDLKGKLFMEAQIYINEGQATVDQIADAVVQAIVDMGATGGLTSEEHTQLMKTLTVGKFLGLK
jgi:ABC-type transporter Mla MlaB component